jgi:hypothetical protein
MKKFFGSALLGAALLGWTGVSNAQEGDEPVAVDQMDISVSPDQVDLAASDDIAGDCVDCCCGSWLDGTYVWIAADTYKGLGERLTNINGGLGSLTGSFGGVAGFNTSVGLGDSRIRGQFGASYGAYDPRGRIGLVPAQNTAEEQVYVTAGVYKRGDMIDCCDPISWGVVYDRFWADNWGINANEIDLGQVRGTFGYALNQCTEVGVWGSFDIDDDLAAVTVAGAPGVRRPVRAMDQLNLYVKQAFEFGGQVTAYAGAIDNADVGDWQFGVLASTPLSCHWSLVGNVNYVSPSARSGPAGSGEEQFDVSVGLAYYFGGNASNASVTGNANVPLLPVASNATFHVTD